MADRYHYDEHGEYRGKTSDKAPSQDEGISFFVLLGLIAFSVVSAALKWVRNFVMNFDSFPAPYSWVGKWYHSFAMLLGVFSDFFSWLWHLQSTPYPNLNTIISLILVAVAGGITLIASVSLLSRLLKNRKGRLACASIGVIGLLGPAAFGLFWYLGASTIGWLFAK